MVISGNYEAASDEQIWGASEFADILMEDQVEAGKKKLRSGFVMPRKRDKLKSPKKLQSDTIDPSQLPSHMPQLQQPPTRILFPTEGNQTHTQGSGL